MQLHHQVKSTLLTFSTLHSNRFLPSDKILKSNEILDVLIPSTFCTNGWSLFQTVKKWEHSENIFTKWSFTKWINYFMNTFDTWHVTHGMWQVTCGMWHVTLYTRAFLFAFSAQFCLFWLLCDYLHTSIDSMSPMCRIILISVKKL